jgi:GTP-binding protein EngB required for normal cell division
MSDVLDRRLAALARAAELADGRLPASDVDAARAVVERAGIRLGLGVQTTVVALAGPTGAGKSTLFNALAGDELSSPGVRRPTTSATAAAVWGAVDPALLDWLGASTRHARPGGPEDGLVLLDLPDYDSVEAANRREVERVIELVDLLVWVVDPQKYADAALHDRYLKPLAGHRESMVLVLNQADRLDAAGLDACRADIGRLVEGDGLPGLPVLAVSARDGDGLDALQRLLDERAAARAAAADRLGADVSRAAERLGHGCEGGKAAGVPKAERARLVATLADAAGVGVVTRAVARSHRRRGALATGWPPARWVRRLRPDPLGRLRLGDGGEDAPHTSLPPATPAQRSQADSAARQLAAAAAGELPDPWPSTLRGAATARETELPDRLDRAVAGAELGLRRPRWWVVAGLLQKLLALLAVVGAVWLLALAALGYLQLEDAVPLPEYGGFPLPTLLLGGGLLLGLLLALASRWAVGTGAARRARVAQRALDARVAEVADELVVEPVKAELAGREELCQALGEARAPSRRRRGEARTCAGGVRRTRPTSSTPAGGRGRHGPRPAGRRRRARARRGRRLPAPAGARGGAAGGGGFAVDDPFTDAVRAPGSGRAGGLPASEDPDRDLRDFSAYVFTEAQKTWEGTLRRAGRPYERAKLVLYRDRSRRAADAAARRRGRSTAGRQAGLPRPLLLPGDGAQRLRAGGDFAWAYVIAHEVGHHVQNELGTNDAVAGSSASGRTTPTTSPSASSSRRTATRASGPRPSSAPATSRRATSRGARRRVRGRRRPPAARGDGAVGPRLLHARHVGAADAMVPDGAGRRRARGLRHVQAGAAVIDKVNLGEALEEVQGHWLPRVVAAYNDETVQVLRWRASSSGTCTRGRTTSSSSSTGRSRSSCATATSGWAPTICSSSRGASSTACTPSGRRDCW